jgi:Sulfotransferase family
MGDSGRERSPAGAERIAVFGDPVFVLCNGRSGSTLLRFLLDAHPDLACPPETNLPGLCVQLATVWSLIEGAPLSANRGDEPPDIPQAAIAGVRDTMDRMVGSYLARRGKKRYCDKSLGTARFAELLLRVYPDARFICMYRHPMDVIASGVEASPWGVTGYGFEPYIAATPGNAVMALANFWTDNTQVTLAAEERFADRCLRVRYEDLVSDPESTAAGVFEFLGVEAVPGISQSCFSAEHERFGPADYKIWYTSRITTDSVGRGWSVPAGMIAPQLLDVINELAGKLGYLAVDGEWGTTEPPGDLRVPIADSFQADGNATANGPRSALAESSSHVPVAAAQIDVERSRRLGERLRAGVEALPGKRFTELRGPHSSETFVAIAVTSNPENRAEYWLVDLGAATVTPTGRQAQSDSDWDMIGAVDAWDSVMDGKVNLSVALRTCQLRYCDNGDTTPLAADTRIGILARLLGLVSWQ